MNTLCSDLLNLVYNHTNPYQCLLLNRDIKESDYDMKWFLYNYECNSTFGKEILNLANKHGLKFLELLYDISLEYQADFGDDYLGWALIKLAFEYGLEYDKIKDLGFMFKCDDDQIRIKSIKYTGYYDVKIKRAKHTEDYIKMIIYAYQNGDVKTIDKVLQRTKNFDYKPGVNILKFIALKDYKNFIIEYNKIKKILSVETILAEIFDEAVVEFGSIDMIDYILEDKDMVDLKSEWRVYESYNERLACDSKFIEYLSGKYNLNMANIAFQLGYDGLCWFKDTDNKNFRTIDIFDGFNIRFRKFDNSPNMIKLNMLRRIFEIDKPSQRELYKLAELAKRFKRYDIYLYVYQLLEC